MAGAINKISPRLIVLIQGSLDKKVPPSETRSLFNSAGKPKKMHLINGAEHSFAYFEKELMDVTLRNLRKWNQVGGQ